MMPPRPRQTPVLGRGHDGDGKDNGGGKPSRRFELSHLLFHVCSETVYTQPGGRQVHLVVAPWSFAMISNISFPITTSTKRKRRTHEEQFALKCKLKKAIVVSPCIYRTLKRRPNRCSPSAGKKISDDGTENTTQASNIWLQCHSCTTGQEVAVPLVFHRQIIPCGTKFDIVFSRAHEIVGS